MNPSKPPFAPMPLALHTFFQAIRQPVVTMALLGLTIASLTACSSESSAPSQGQDHAGSAARAVPKPLDPNSPLAKARALRASGQSAEAEAILAQAALTTPDDIDLHREYQDLLRSAKKVEEGRTFYKAQLDARPTSAIAWYLHGRAMILESPLEAENAFRKALELDPNFLWAYLGLGTVQTIKGDGFAAVQMYERALEKFPSSADLYFNLADARSSIGALRTGLEAVEKTLELAPDHAKAWELKGFIQKQQGDLAGAEKSLEKALGLQDSLGLAHLALAEILAGKGALDAARPHAQKAQQLGKTLTEPLLAKFPELATPAVPATAPAPVTPAAPATAPAAPAVPAAPTARPQ